MKNRIRMGIALSLWCGLVGMVPASLLFVLLMEKNPIDFYFTENHVFYVILVSMLMLFFLGMAFGGDNNPKPHRDHEIEDMNERGNGD